jgi:response regulator RpfG family c-di-GMP phosphodiesterase
MDHHVLFVDDEPNVLNAIRRLVHGQPWDTHLAASGRLGLDIMAEQEMCVLVSDLHMPAMDGTVFLRKARALQPRATRMVLSSLADRESVVNAVITGEIWRYILKPWEDEALLDAIRAAIAEFEKHRA